MVKMDLPSSDSQAASMKGLTASRIEGYNSAIAALAAFQGAGDLQGAAYDSGKTYGTAMITPLIQGAILLSEAVSEGATGLPKKYRAEVGGESLDSDILEAQIAAYERSLGSLRGSYQFLEKAEGTSAETLKGMASRMSEISAAKNDAQDKLRKLYAFAASSNAVFGNLPHITEAMDMGIAQISTEFANFSGTFHLPPADQLGWTQTIGVEWRKKESIDENYQKVLEKMERGEKLNDKDVKALQAYAERYPQRDLPDNVRDALEKAGQKQAKKVNKKGSQTVESSNINGILDELFGSENTTEVSHRFERNAGLLYSLYVEATESATKDEKGIFKYKTTNGKPSGIAVDFKIFSVDVDVSDSHIELSPKLSLFGYQINHKFNAGLNHGNNLPELNLSLGYGEEGKSSDDWGMRVAMDPFNGVLGGFHKSTKTDEIGDITVERSFEEGFQTVNALEGAVALAIIYSPVYAPAIVSGVGPVIQQIGEKISELVPPIIPNVPVFMP